MSPGGYEVGDENVVAAICNLTCKHCKPCEPAYFSPAMHLDVRFLVLERLLERRGSSELSALAGTPLYSAEAMS